MDTHQKFSGHHCEKCGGPAPDWKCDGCGQCFHVFDGRHAISCAKQGRVRAKCNGCGEAETKCAC